MNNNSVMYKGNSAYKLSAFQPYMKSINTYIIYYDKYSFYSYDRRVTGDKYSYVLSRHMFLIDLTDIDRVDRDEFVSKNWASFIWQLADINKYSNKTILSDRERDSIFPLKPQDHNGEYATNTVYTTTEPIEFTFNTLFNLYGAMLLVLDLNPSSLSLTIYSGYENSRNNGETQYYNTESFRQDFMKLNE